MLLRKRSWTSSLNWYGLPELMVVKILALVVFVMVMVVVVVGW
jgi:hypothetical protein